MIGGVEEVGGVGLEEVEEVEEEVADGEVAGEAEEGILRRVDLMIPGSAQMSRYLWKGSHEVPKYLNLFNTFPPLVPLKLTGSPKSHEFGFTQTKPLGR